MAAAGWQAARVDGVLESLLKQVGLGYQLRHNLHMLSPPSVRVTRERVIPFISDSFSSTLPPLTSQGLALVDDQGPGGERLFWFPCLAVNQQALAPATAGPPQVFGQPTVAPGR